jgi:hypothetical protein
VCYFSLHLFVSRYSCEVLIRSSDKDSVVSIPTCYGLDDPGIKSRWGRDIPHLSWHALGLTYVHVQYNGCRVSFPRMKRPGRGDEHSAPSSAQVNQRVQLYLYSPSGSSWPLLGRILRLLISSASIDIPSTLDMTSDVSHWAVFVLDDLQRVLLHNSMWECLWYISALNSTCTHLLIGYPALKFKNIF